jgi:hypothetical protein
MSDARRMQALTRALFVITAILNIVPVVGVTSGARLEQMYSVVIGSPDLVLLMRHRALLLAIVGGMLFAAAFRPALRPAAFAAGLVSMVSFVVLVAGGDEVGASLRTVATVDLVGIAILLAGGALDRRLRRTRN